MRTFALSSSRQARFPYEGKLTRTLRERPLFRNGEAGHRTPSIERNYRAIRKAVELGVRYAIVVAAIASLIQSSENVM